MHTDINMCSTADQAYSIMTDILRWEKYVNLGDGAGTENKGEIISSIWPGRGCVHVITWCSEGCGEGGDMDRGVTCSGSLTDVGVEDECGGEICSHTFLSIISFMSSRFIPILNISPSTSLRKLWHTHTHT